MTNGDITTLAEAAALDARENGGGLSVCYRLSVCCLCRCILESVLPGYFSASLEGVLRLGRLQSNDCQTGLRRACVRSSAVEHPLKKICLSNS
eukprot:scaffold14557_cov114-Isochrysis_galbana.AAC.1